MPATRMSRTWPHAAPNMKNDQPMPVASQKPPPISAHRKPRMPGAVVQADFELERAAGRPADQLRGLIRKEHMRDEAEHEADGADIEHEGVDEEDAQDVAPGSMAPWSRPDRAAAAAGSAAPSATLIMQCPSRAGAS